MMLVQPQVKLLDVVLKFTKVTLRDVARLMLSQITGKMLHQHYVTFLERYKVFFQLDLGRQSRP